MIHATARRLLAVLLVLLVTACEPLTPAHPGSDLDAFELVMPEPPT